MKHIEGKKKKGLVEGIVVSDKMDKTIVVSVDTFKTHPKYLKRYIVTKKYKAHDPENRFKIGDRAKIRQSKPMSKEKKWVVIYNKQGTVNSDQ